MKRGLDQVSAWLLATVLAGATFGVVYGVARFAARPHDSHGGQSEHGVAPPGHGGEHAAQGGHAEAPHSEPSGHGAQTDAHGGGHGEDAAPKASASGAGHGTGHGDDHGDEAKSKGHDDARQRSREEGRSVAALDSAVPWDYRGSTGPDHWGELSSSYLLCKTGKRQSPVDIDQTAAGGKLLPLRFHYKKAEAELRYNGRMLSVLPQDRGLGLDLEGERYDLVRMDVHAPSQHKISGLPYDLELSFLHKDASGRWVVVNVLVEEGVQNAGLEGLVALLPMRGDSVGLAAFDPEALLPQKRTYYRYDGSLTMPPCSEGTVQLVMTRAIEASARQVDALVGVLGFNSRPVQALNGRKVLKSTR
jgi:carbonic anhydrase